MAYDGTNKKRDSATYKDGWSKRSDWTQILANQAQWSTDFGNDHSTTTGKHNAGSIIADYFGTSLVAADTTKTLGLAVDSYIFTGLSPINGLNIYCYTTGTLPGAAEVVWRSDQNTVGYQLIRRTAATTSQDVDVRYARWLTIDDRYDDINRLSTASGLGPAVSDAQPTNQPNPHITKPDNTLVTYGETKIKSVIKTALYGYLATHYDRYFQNHEILRDRFRWQHDDTSSWASDVYAMKHLYNATVFTFTSQSYTTSTFTTFDLGSYGSSYLHILFRAANASASAAVLWLPAWDDSNCYLVAWQGPNSDGAADTAGFHGALIPLNETSTSATLTGNWDTTLAEAQGDAIDPDIFDQVEDNQTDIEALITAEHGTTGMHNIPLDTFTGYTLVEDETSITVSGSVGGVTAHTLEAIPADSIYFFALKGAASSGIVAASLGGDDTNTILYTRRVTSGSSNSFTMTVVRVNQT